MSITMEKLKEIVIEVMKSNTKEMEGYSYFGTNPGISADDYEDVADEVVKMTTEAEIRLRDYCPTCNNPWLEHEFGVPAPYCP